MSQRPRCPNCNGRAALAFCARDTNRRISRQRFPYWCCRGCGLVFLASVPPDLDRYYPSDYYQLSLSADELAHAAAGERYKIEIVKQYARGQRLLEIGPGCGGFACLAKEAGFAVSAVEMNAESCRYLTDVIGVRSIHRSDVAGAILDEEPYDVIAAWHVIEHLPDPWSLIAAAAARLSAGGILIVAAPNPQSFQFRVLGHRWVHLDAPRHLNLIPVSVLERRATAHGLRPVLATTRDEGGLFWNRFGWIRSLQNILPRRPARAFVPAAQRLGLSLAALLRAFDETELRGTAYTLVFQK